MAKSSLMFGTKGYDSQMFISKIGI